MLLAECTLSLLACSPSGIGERSREERALELVQRLQRETIHASWYRSTSFHRVAGESDGSSERWVPSIPIDCGNSDGGDFDDRVAGVFGIELCKIFGVQAEADFVVEEPGVRAVLDGADPHARVGFCLRGIPGHGMAAPTEPEEPPTELSIEEAKRLADSGWRIFVANVSEFALMDSDQFTPTLAFLGGLAEHLNRVTDGADVDLSGLLFAKTLYHRLPEVQFVRGAGPSTHLSSRYRELDVREPTTVRLAFPGREAGFPFEPLPRDVDPATQNEAVRRALQAGPDFPARTRGAPSVLCFGAFRDPGSAASSPPDGHWPSPFAALRIVQTGADGRELRCETAAANLFLPSDYDLSRPFTVELDLAPGKHLIADSVRLGASDRVGE